MAENKKEELKSELMTETDPLLRTLYSQVDSYDDIKIDPILDELTKKSLN